MSAVMSGLAGITPPAWLRKAEAAVLMAVFADAFQVEPPSVRRLDAAGALEAFQLFTAACMEAALADGHLADRYRARLGERACTLGDLVRRVLLVRPARAMDVTAFLYRGIDIQLSGALPGAVTFGPCSFARAYSPGACWLMSAFDEGFMRGISGVRGADLVFSCRLTEGAPCCRATFSAGAGT